MDIGSDGGPKKESYPRVMSTLITANFQGANSQRREVVKGVALIREFNRQKPEEPSQSFNVQVVRSQVAEH